MNTCCSIDLMQRAINNRTKIIITGGFKDTCLAGGYVSKVSLFKVHLNQVLNNITYGTWFLFFKSEGGKPSTDGDRMMTATSFIILPVSPKPLPVSSHVFSGQH